MRPYVTKDQAARARQIHVLDYILQYEAQDYKRLGNSYRMKEHPSLAVGHDGFYWHSQKLGGKTALDYLVQVRQMDFVTAVYQLIGEAPHEKGKVQYPNTHQGRSPPATTTPLPATITQAEPPKPLSLPRRNKTHHQVIAYLQNRGLDREIIQDCINRGSLFESALYRNAVFTGKDEQGKIKFAALRDTHGDFKRDVEGSDKRYGFTILPSNPDSQSVMLFESPIDCLSHQTLCKCGDIPDFDGWRLSLGGTASVAAHYFLSQHPEVSHCIIATDNDEAGHKIAQTLATEISVTTQRILPLHGKDWNDTLRAVIETQRKPLHITQDTPTI